MKTLLFCLLKCIRIRRLTERYFIEDLSIGANAKILGVPIATANESDFKLWEIEIIKPFK